MQITSLAKVSIQFEAVNMTLISCHSIRYQHHLSSLLRERVTAMAERREREGGREEGKSDDSARYEIGLEDLELLPPMKVGLNLREISW